MELCVSLARYGYAGAAAPSSFSAWPHEQQPTAPEASYAPAAAIATPIPAYEAAYSPPIATALASQTSAQFGGHTPPDDDVSVEDMLLDLGLLDLLPLFVSEEIVT